MRNPFDFLCESLSFWILLFLIDNIVFEKSEHSNLNKYLHNPLSYLTKTWYMFGVWHPVNDSNNSGCWRIMVFLVLAILQLMFIKRNSITVKVGNPTKETSLIPKVDWNIIWCSIIIGWIISLCVLVLWSLLIHW